MESQTRCAPGRQRPNVACHLCHGMRPESLGRILQQCSAVAGKPLVRHDGLLDLYVTSLQKKGYQVPTTAGVWYPNMVLWRDGTACVVGVQVVADAAVGSLDTAHRWKVTYYHVVPEIRDYVVSLTGNKPIFSSFTI